MSDSPPPSPSQQAATAHAYASNGLEILQAATDAAQAAHDIQNPQAQALQHAAAAAEAVSQQQQQQQQHHHEHHDPHAIAALAQATAGDADPNVNPQLVPGPGGMLRDPTINPKLTRLRRACDMCSMRKVKCDDSTIPCRPCRELGVECTYERETKRRGPPNKHAEAAKAAKRTRLEIATASPSPQNAAKTLMNISTDGILDAESIAPMPVLELLIDDFFTYIHPLVPFPHEPTFRQSFANREDRTKPEFLGLLAAMVGLLAASFPRSAREHLKTQHSAHVFPRAIVMVERCREISLLTRGSKWVLKQPKTLDEACTSYMLAMAAGYTLQWNTARHFLAETLILLRELGYARPNSPGEVPSFGADPYSGDALPFNHVKDEIGKRVFWALLIGTR